MVEYTFKRYEVECTELEVTYSMPPNQKTETILVAADWMMGQSDPDEAHKTGFLGSGSAKNVVYVSTRLILFHLTPTQLNCL